MKPRPWPLVYAISCGLLFWASQACVLGKALDSASVNAGTTHQTPDIQRLIAQLGHEQYVLRQQAETQLLQRGAEAFAELQAAEHHLDLEVATRAKYILNQISIEWIRPTDPPEVRLIMKRYGQLSPQSRLAKVYQLAALESEQGLGALCRIARFDSSTQVTRFAALEILDQGFLPSERASAAAARLLQEMGDSDRAPLRWIRTYANQLQTPQVNDSSWLAMIQAEIKLLDQEAGQETNQETNKASQPTIIKLFQHYLDWAIHHQHWKAFDLLEDQHPHWLSGHRPLLYLMAIGRDQQGHAAIAEKLAEQAFELEPQNSAETDSDQLKTDSIRERNQVADTVATYGRHDWAEREWRQVVKTLPAWEFQSLLARQSLGLFRLNDRGEHQAAANLMTETLDAINGNAAIKRQYHKNRALRSLLKSFQSNRDFFLACHFEEQADFDKQRKHLELAYKLGPDNADILIAMYHSRDASDDYRKSTRVRILRAKIELETSIQESPDDPHSYNHWAWLVSNTEGDFAKAVDYSKRSLELDPDSPSYLDTLGRCYYAAGDLESAVKVQRQAVAKHPHLMVMRRQLKSFESELQKNAATDN